MSEENGKVDPRDAANRALLFASSPRASSSNRLLNQSNPSLPFIEKKVLAQSSPGLGSPLTQSTPVLPTFPAHSPPTSTPDKKQSLAIKAGHRTELTSSTPTSPTIYKSDSPPGTHTPGTHTPGTHTPGTQTPTVQSTPGSRNPSPPRWTRNRHHMHTPSGGSSTEEEKIMEEVVVRDKTTRKGSSKNLLEDYGGEDILRQKLSELKDRRKKSTYGNSQQVEQMLNLSLENLNITSGDDDNFDQLESFMKESQQDQAVKEALMKGVELKEYGKQVEEELNACEADIVPVYIDMRNEIGDLHVKIGGCVEILSAFETLLNTFQADLGNISEDIKMMQDQSMDKNMKINNRKGVITKLHRFIEDISLPPGYVEQLEKGTVDLSYIQILTSFNRKLGFIEMNATRGVISIQDMRRRFGVVLEKVIVRVQKYIISQTSTVKSFAQLRETQEFLCELSFLFQFLFIHAPDNARDVKAVYMEACDKFYTNYYKSYLSSLSKLQAEIATKSDVIGTEDNKLKSFFGGKTKMTKTSVFTLGSRAAILDTNAAPLDIPSSSSSNSPKYTYEELFRSMLRLLADQANCEFMFIRDFFLADDDATFGIFLRSSDLLLESVEGYVTNTFDTVGLLIMLCLIDRMSEEISPKLEYLLGTLNKASSMLFSRFVFVFELNMISIKNATISPQDLGTIDIRTHYVTRRYGELSASIITLYGTLPDQVREKIAICLAKMREAIAKLLVRLSEELKDKKEQNVFLINNYDLILSLIQNRGVNAEDVAFFTGLLNQAGDMFVKLQKAAAPHVAQIAAFIDEVNPIIQKNESEGEITHSKINKDVMEGLLKQFSHHWREGLDGWSAEIPKLFSNFKIGMMLFKNTVDQTFSLYKQFVNIIGKTHKALKTTKFFLSETEIKSELRKFDMDI